MAKRYKKNYIKQVIARVDFPEPITDSKEFPKPLVDAILKIFPIQESQDIVGREFQFQIASQELSHREVFKATEWNFWGKKREKQLNLGPLALFLSYTHYEGFPKFQDDFSTVLQAFESAFPGVLIRRFGLRYINHIELAEGNPLEWSKYLSGSLLHIFDSIPSDAKVARAMQVTELLYDDGALRFQFGMHNPDFPAEIRQKIFVLDFDAYREGLIDIEQSKRQLEVYHSRIRKMFSASILDPLAKHVDWGKEGRDGE